MNIGKMFEGIKVGYEIPAETEITGIAYDSRAVKPGSIFVCIKGFASDGHKYIKKAAEAGAVCALVQEDCEFESGILPVIVCPDTRIALGRISAAFFNQPAKQLEIVGVTGTNGKTTTTYMLAEIFQKAKKSCGIIGTISYKAGNKVYEASNTTPESYEIQKMFREMVDGGNSACMMEVSSHALYMNRVESVPFNCAIFTNLTEDHLDFHKDFEEYYQAKKKLFYLVGGSGLINIDDKYGDRMYDELKSEGVAVLSYSTLDMQADYFCEVMYKTDTCSVVKMYYKGELMAGLKINIPGAFSVYNALAAFSAAHQQGIDAADIISGIEGLNGVPGRFELVPNDKNVVVIVDYAHTPDALIKVLDTANEFKKGRLICVFGCGGDRDRTKRPMMGRAAGERCELCIITSDNPRTEDPKTILMEIEKGIQETKCSYEIIVDRKAAIDRAIQLYLPGDVIIVAGKGHEDYQIIGTTKIHFDDKEVIAEILQR